MKATKPKASWIGLQAAFWMIAVLGAYYIYHKPFTSELALHWLAMGGQLVVALAISALAGGLGRRLFVMVGLRPTITFGVGYSDPLVRLSLEAGLGLGFLGIGYLMIGALVGVSSWLSWLLLLGGLFALHREILGWFRQAGALPELYRTGGRLGRLLAAALALVFALGLLGALAPPLKFDSLVYHLALPLGYLARGRMAFEPGNMYWGMPQMAEMLYTWGIALAGRRTFALLSWCFGLLAVLGLAGFIRRHLGARAAWVGCASLAGGLSLAGSLSWGYVDWLAMLFGLATFVLLEAWLSSSRRRDLLLAGIFAGFALGTKYTAGVVALSGIAVILGAGTSVPGSSVPESSVPASPGGPGPGPASGPNPESPARPGTDSGTSVPESWITWNLHHLLTFFLTLTLASLPWLLKNLLATGNPFYPFIFPTETMSALRLSLYQGLPPWGGLENVLLLPWQATITGVEAASGYGVSTGPLLLALGAMSWMGWRGRTPGQRRLLRAAWLFSLAAWIVWAAAGRLSGLLIQTRLYQGVFTVLGVLAAAGFDGLARFRWPGVRLGRIASVALLGVAGLNLFELAGTAVQRRVPEYIFGQVSEEQFLEHNLGMYALAMQAVVELPPGSRVRMLWEPRAAGCLPLCEPDEILDEWFVSARTYQLDVDAILAAWKEAGFSHVLYYGEGRDFYRQDQRYLPQDWRALDSLLARLPAAVDLNGIYTIYEIP